MSSASKTKDVTDAIAFSVNGDKEKFKDEFADMDIDEREMTFPIKSEENVQKERKLLVDGTLYHEKRKAIEVCDRSDNKFLNIGVLRKIGDKMYQTTELFKNGESPGQKCNLCGDEKQKFEDEWKEKWKPLDADLESAKTKEEN